MQDKTKIREYSVKKHYQLLGLATCLSVLLTLSGHAVSAEGDEVTPVADTGVAADLERLEQQGKVVTQSIEYTVVAGDSLSKIAERIYGTHKLWVAILNANDDQLQGDPLAIHPGLQLQIPALAEASANNELPERDEMDEGLPGEQAYLDQLDNQSEDGMDDGLASGAGAGNSGKPVISGSNWVYTEGVARAIRREYLTFESPGRIAFLDPKLKEGDRVRKGQVLAYQEQSRSAASMAGANARLISSNTQFTKAQSQVSDAHAQLVRAQSQLAVMNASRMEADANLLLAQRTFQRFSTLLKQKSASQQEYDEAQARLASAKAAALRTMEQINAAKADINVAKTGINTAKAGIATAKAGVADAKAGLGTAQVAKKESYLISPIDGLVARLNIEQGYYYSPQYLQTQTEQQAFNSIPIILIDPSRFEIAINLPADHYDLLQVGAEAYVDIVSLNATLEERLPVEARGPKQALNSFRIRGRVHSISPVLDTDLRNFVVNIRTTAGEQLLRDGENVSLWIKRSPARRQATNQ